MNLEVGLIELLKTAVEINLGLLLLNKWRKSLNPMYTDLPFIFGLALAMIGVGEAFDAFGDLGFFEYTIVLFKIRWLFIVAMMTISLFGLTHIWMPNHQKTKTGIPMIFGGSWLAVAMLLPDRYTLYQVLIGYLVVFFIPYILTFILIYYYRRLPEVNSGILVIGMVIILIGQISKSSLMILGLLSVSEFIDLIGFSLTYVAFAKPPKWTKELSPPRESRL